VIAPVPQNEAARLEVLLACQILDTPPEPSFDALVAEVANAVHAPIAVIGFIDQDRHWFKAKFGTDVTVNKREWATCAHTIYQNSTLVCPNIALEPRFADMPPLSHFGIQAYAGTPILVDGCAIGTVCVFDHVVRPFTPNQIAALVQYARLVAERLTERLSKTHRLLSRIRQAPQPPAQASLEPLGQHWVRIRHSFALPNAMHWQLWGMNPHDTRPQQLKAFTDSSLELRVPSGTQLLLLSLESDHQPASQPTEIRAVLRPPAQQTAQVLA
jgi:GAF domain-containing protein